MSDSDTFLERGIGCCETCGKPIFEGEQYGYSSDGCYFCEEHAYSLSDVLIQHKQILADNDEWSLGEMDMTRDELAQQVEAIEKELATSGDRKILMTA